MLNTRQAGGAGCTHRKISRQGVTCCPLVQLPYPSSTVFPACWCAACFPTVVVVLVHVVVARDGHEGAEVQPEGDARLGVREVRRHMRTRAPTSGFIYALLCIYSWPPKT